MNAKEELMSWEMRTGCPIKSPPAGNSWGFAHAKTGEERETFLFYILSGDTPNGQMRCIIKVFRVKECSVTQFKKEGNILLFLDQ